MYKNGIYFYLTVNGRTIDEYFKDGKTYVEGRKDSEYEIVINNNTNIRKKIVLSVDGLNVITGDATWDRGYALAPWKSITIPGWRIDNSKVAKFIFASIANSYNQHNDAGQKANVGVIGAKFFDEIQPVPTPWYTSSFTISGVTLGDGHHVHNYHEPTVTHDSFNLNNTAGGMPSGSVNCSYSAAAVPTSKIVEISARPRSSKPEFKQLVGTGWGHDKTFKTHTVNYNFHQNPCETLMIYYDSLKGLKRRGIRIEEKHTVQIEPNAFPGYRDGCPYPK